MMSISRTISLRSFFFLYGTILAASSSPVCFSRHRNTVPNVPRPSSGSISNFWRGSTSNFSVTSRNGNDGAKFHWQTLWLSIEGLTWDATIRSGTNGSRPTPGVLASVELSQLLPRRGGTVPSSFFWRHGKVRSWHQTSVLWWW
uniref:Putative secreted protein n=1 Tax=Anopheles darlingi TaxID=43151 RepID=A0A2M4D9Z3_ANODA